MVDFSLGSVVKVGGPVMLFLIVCSVISISVMLDRFYCYYTSSRFSRERFMNAIRQKFSKNDIEGALAVCREMPSPFSAVVSAGLNAAGLEEKHIIAAMDREMIVQTRRLQERTAIVGTIGSTSVYIGLLGTVWGIIKAFKDMSLSSAGGIDAISVGISEALICTGAGLVVAIPAVAAYNWFVKRIDECVDDMELCASEITSLISRSGQR